MGNKMGIVAQQVTCEMEKTTKDIGKATHEMKIGIEKGLPIMTDKIRKPAENMGKATHEMRVGMIKAMPYRVNEMGKVAVVVGRILYITGTIPLIRKIFKKILRIALITSFTTTIIFLFTFAFYPLLVILGFTSGGVSAGSLAALWQSSMCGFIPAGSLFSLFQSISRTAWL
ncbi:hypothetical protein HI914_03148 [Erysiphe necator]|nr:hypothetical protein HI914_03148 [Erysiphe necator]